MLPTTGGLIMAWIAVLLGIVEGLTEFLPVSSTGHLIIASEMLHFEGKRAEVFMISIQLGAILAVVWEYRHRLFRVVADLPKRAEARWFTINVSLAFIPAAVAGLLFFDWISERLFNPITVAAALIVGALLIFVVESLPMKVKTQGSEPLSWRQALFIGAAQCFALWPGFSRSTATILGGLIAGLDRRAATEFSFFLAIPVMFSATGYHLVGNSHHLDTSDFGWLGVCFLVSFLVAWASIRWLLRFVSTHSFKPFAWYRLGVGVLALAWYLPIYSS